MNKRHDSAKRYEAQFSIFIGVDFNGDPFKTSLTTQVADKAGLADRRANALLGELDESRSLLESTERGKKQAEMELHDTRVAINDLSTINGRAANDKRQLETAVHTLHAEIDSHLQSAKNAEEKAKKAMVDASR